MGVHVQRQGFDHLCQVHKPNPTKPNENENENEQGQSESEGGGEIPGSKRWWLWLWWWFLGASTTCRVLMEGRGRPTRREAGTKHSEPVFLQREHGDSPSQRTLRARHG